MPDRILEIAEGFAHERYNKRLGELSAEGQQFLLEQARELSQRQTYAAMWLARARQ